MMNYFRKLYETHIKKRESSKKDNYNQIQSLKQSLNSLNELNKEAEDVQKKLENVLKELKSTTKNLETAQIEQEKSTKELRETISMRYNPPQNKIIWN